VSADGIAVGHTRDDQAETLLLKLVRGAGLSGLAGVYPRRGLLIRPLLDVTRADLRAYLQARAEAWVEDESNENVINPRNRIRHRVIPELELAYPGASRAIARTAAATREDGQWLDDLAHARYEALVVATPNGKELDAALLSAEPRPLQRRIVLAAVRSLAAGREAGLEHVETALGVLAGECAGADLPGCRVELRRGKLVLESRRG
jgi:tRNA(Ile)-lysidine synthase